MQAYAYFPYAVAQGIDDFHGGEISVRFKPVAGRIDQGAGILFNLKPNGDYLTIRANCLENNLVLWKFEKGKRSSVKWVRDTPTPSRQWHELKVRIDGAKVEAEVVSHGKHPKVWHFRTQEEGWDRIRGHRQPYTEIKITGITSRAAEGG